MLLERGDWESRLSAPPADRSAQPRDIVSAPCLQLRPQTERGSPAPGSQLSQTISFPKAYYVLLKSHYQNRGDSAISLVCKLSPVFGRRDLEAVREYQTSALLSASPVESQLQISTPNMTNKNSPNADTKMQTEWL